MTTTSLRRRLLFILLGLTLVSWVLAGMATLVVANQLINQQIERQLTEYMDIVQHSMAVIMDDAVLTQRYRDQSQVQIVDSGIRRSRGFGTEGQAQAINIWFGTSQVLVGNNAPAFPRPVEDGVVWNKVLSDSASRWSILYRKVPNHAIWLAVGVDQSQAANIGLTTITYAILPLLVVLPLSIVALWWGVTRGLAPLRGLAQSIEARQPETLDPIESADSMVEIRPVISAINRLLERLGRALDSERRFTANAAHELQTPLAAIKAEVQRYQRQVNEDGSRDMLLRISERVHRATDTVTQLLTLARLDPEQAFDCEPVELHELLIDVIAEEGALAVDRGLDIQVPEPCNVSVQGNKAWLTILVRNLLVNAFRHTPASGVVQISLRRDGDCRILEVANDCEPIPNNEWERLTQRFYTRGASGSNGVGLGLSIAQRVADLHGAQLSLSPQTGQRGFLAQVVFN